MNQQLQQQIINYNRIDYNSLVSPFHPTCTIKQAKLDNAFYMNEYPLFNLVRYNPNKDLKDFCRTNKLKVSGNRKELIRRIFKSTY